MICRMNKKQREALKTLNFTTIKLLTDTKESPYITQCLTNQYLKAEENFDKAFATESEDDHNHVG